MRHAAGFGEVEEVAQGLYAAAGGAGDQQIAGAKGGEHLHAFLGAGEEHIEAAPAVRAVDGAEALRHCAAYFHRAIGGGNVDDVALVTLDVFQVLDEQRLFSCVITVAGFLQCWVLLGELLQGALDLFGLLDVHRDDTKRFVWTM